MLLQFNVTNALSFKDEAILDLIADTDSSHEENLIKNKNSKVLPSIAIYGANASGKSNLFKALTAAILYVRNSNNMQINSKIALVPFLLDQESRYNPVRMDFIFVRNEIKYEYGFAADSEKVYEEYLYAYKSAKPSLIFERFEVNKYRYTASLKNSLKQYESKNADNKLFLATATAWNCQETKEAFLWFAEDIDTFDRASIEGAMSALMDADKNNLSKGFLLKALNIADFNISDYEYTAKTSDLSQIPLPPGLALDEKLLGEIKAKTWDLRFVHDVENSEQIEKYVLPYQMESNGTMSFVAYGLVIYEALKKGKTIVVDEIDNGLHPVLVQYLINLFNHSKVNRNGAQLIFNTHAVTLLDLDVFRRDQIYFVEKDNKTGKSELFALSDFSPRKTEKVQKGYLQGRYGALPEIGLEDITW